MFEIDDDMTIYITRGDVAFFSVTAEDNGERYKFQPGDVVRIKVTQKKNCENVAFQKDFPVLEETETVEILLTEEETKIGDVISKPVDYWYEVELNPYTNPQTIIGYDDDGPKIFKLFPEGRDLNTTIEKEELPVVDSELSLTSDRPVANQAVARAITDLSGIVKKVSEDGSSAVAAMTKKVDDAVNKASKDTERLDTEISIERARINNLVANAGDTDNNAELLDMRVGADGKTYETAGEAVRGQVGDLKSDLSKLGMFYPTWVKGYYSVDNGKLVYRTATHRISFADGTLLTPEYPCEVSINAGYKYWVHVLDENNAYLYSMGPETEPYTLDVGFSYVITMARTDDGAIDLTENKCEIFIKEYDTRIEEHEGRLNHNGKKLFNLVRGVWTVAEPPYFGASDARLATPVDEYIEFESDVIVTPYLGYSYLLLKYDKDTKEYVGYDSWTKYSKILSSDFAYRIDFRKNDNSNITIEERTCIFYTAETKPVFESRYFKDLHETRFYEKENNLVSKVLSDKTANTVTFGVITDTHHAQSDNRRTAKQGKALARLCGRVGATFMVHLGDVIEGACSTLALNKFDLAEYWGEQNDTSIPILYTLAHHEQYGAKGASGWGNDATAITPSECIGMYGCTNKYLDVTYTDDKANWYVDIGNIRFIGLDCTSNTNRGFSDAVITFVRNALADSDKKVIMFCHMPLRASVNWSNGSTIQGDSISSLLNNYNGEVLAYFHGHTHWDNIYKDASDKFPYISICGAVPVKMDIATYGCESGNPTAYDRVVGEYSEYCFDIVNIHTDTGEIKMFRFGVGNDRTYTQSN